MAEKEQTPGFTISSAIRAERQSRVSTDRSSLSHTLVKSPLWKKNTLQRTESGGFCDNDVATIRNVDPRQESKSLRKELALHVEVAESARRRLRQQAATLRKRSDEIERLRQTIANLESKNANLTAEYQSERDAHKVEMLELQKAYDQFEQLSDQLLNELDQKNERLRIETSHHNGRSVL